MEREEFNITECSKNVSAINPRTVSKNLLTKFDFNTKKLTSRHCLTNAAKSNVDDRYLCRFSN